MIGLCYAKRSLEPWVIIPTPTVSTPTFWNLTLLTLWIIFSKSLCHTKRKVGSNHTYLQPFSTISFMFVFSCWFSWMKTNWNSIRKNLKTTDKKLYISTKIQPFWNVLKTFPNSCFVTRVYGHMLPSFFLVWHWFRPLGTI